MKKLVYVIIGILSIISANALVITEIMYDISGSETGREWIEVYNDDPFIVDLNYYGLNESNMLHHFQSFLDSSNQVLPGGYAVLTPDAEKFLIDYQGYSGKLFESGTTFRLNNGGETLILQDGSGNIVDIVTYSPLASQDYSIELKGLGLENNNMSNWQESIFKGTPGYSLTDNDQTEVPEFTIAALSIVLVASIIFINYKSP